MRIFSGIQPTGVIHIGNYCGALKQWVELQKNNECLFCIVDLHALTSEFNPENLQELILEKAIAYLSAGIDPKKSIIYVQSHIKEHTELAWLLNTITPIGDLTRMTQYKEKARKFKKNLNAGLLNYPILMSADILLYQTEIVPVGKDQKQHVELTRTIARKFNQKFGETFKIPNAFLPKHGAKIMSLTEPRKKMSKSDKPESYIGLFDKPEIIEKKIITSITDSGKEIIYNPEKKPGISNLLTIYSLFSEKSIKSLEKEFEGKGYSSFKNSLAVLIKEKLEPFRKKKKELLSKKNSIKKILDNGKKRAHAMAIPTIKKARKKMGLT